MNAVEAKVSRTRHFFRFLPEFRLKTGNGNYFTGKRGLCPGFREIEAGRRGPPRPKYHHKCALSLLCPPNVVVLWAKKYPKTVFPAKLALLYNPDFENQETRFPFPAKGGFPRGGKARETGRHRAASVYPRFVFGLFSVCPRLDRGTFVRAERFFRSDFARGKSAGAEKRRGSEGRFPGGCFRASFRGEGGLSSGD
jgi:hypothetical protein